MDFIELSQDETVGLLMTLQEVHDGGSLYHGGIRKLRVAVDGDHVKFKINEGTWSPPLGKKGEPY